jgi:phage terminase large subunit-like protein
LLASLPPQEQASLLSELDPAALEFDWPFWARRNQLAPAGEWGNWLIIAGRGFGKTRTGAEWVRANLCGDTPLTGGRYRHVALVAETAADARDVMVGDGRPPSDPSAGSGILQVHAPDFRPLYEPSKRRLTWRNGAIATIYNAVEPDQLRGPQHDAAWCDELCKWRYAQDTWDQLQFGLRTGADPRVAITTTPKPIKLLKEILGDPDTITTRGSTLENASNLAPRFLATILRKYQGTRLGRQEIEAEILDDTPGALWMRAVIESLRVKPNEVPQLTRIVVAIDPGASSNEDSNETGIVAVGLGANGHGYVLDDQSKVYKPHEWAAEAIALFKARKADRIVAEVNNGGEMVENTLRVVDPNVPYRAVHASRGKAIRAEPVSALYEQKRVHHVGAFPLLEDQMCAFTSDFDSKVAGYSPDRMDALVWALTELMVDEISAAGWLGLAGERNAAAAVAKAPAATVLLSAPPGISRVSTITGRQASINNDGNIEVTEAEAKPLLGAGFKRI